MIHIEKSSREVFKCHLCPATSSRKDSLQRHIKAVHEERRNYSCSFCEKKYASVHGLKRHVEAKHPIHSCDKCEYETHSKHDLEQHVTSHHIADTFDCDDCPRKFRKFELLVHHIGREHMNEKEDSSREILTSLIDN